MSLTLRDLISENLEFTYQIHWEDMIQDVQFDYQFKVRFNEGFFEFEDNGDFIDEVLTGSINDADQLHTDIREMILDKCEDLLS